ncbi:OTU domain-containing protein 5-like, partial [Passer montanus]|uniref:OTU domain-containing protein 5-like n=1 Tax=Passer montanus TaxID=9160 RepID=UPI001961D0AE
GGRGQSAAGRRGRGALLLADLEAARSHWRRGRRGAGPGAGALGGAGGGAKGGAKGGARRSPARRLVLGWFLLCAGIHGVLEGYFSLRHRELPADTGLLADVWKEYAKADSRYMTSDDFTVAMETVTAWAWGPLSFLTFLALLRQHPARHVLQLVVSLGMALSLSLSLSLCHPDPVPATCCSLWCPWGPAGSGPGCGLGLGLGLGPGCGSPGRDEAGGGYNSEDEYEAGRVEMDPATAEQAGMDWGDWEGLGEDWEGLREAGNALVGTGMDWEATGRVLRTLGAPGCCSLPSTPESPGLSHSCPPCPSGAVPVPCVPSLSPAVPSLSPAVPSCPQCVPSCPQLSPLSLCPQMKNADYFSNYVTEDFTTYINRKRKSTCHGNHIEMQAMAEMYNRPVEVYQYGTEPINTFHGIQHNEDEPIRVSYHRNIHYNSVVNPNKATIGVGLGLPSFKPGLAEQSLMKSAIKTSEESWIEQQMLEDKKRATDWEATNEAIEEQVARESYLQWLRDQEKQARQPRKASATCSSATAAAASGLEEWSGPPQGQRHVQLGHGSSGQWPGGVEWPLSPVVTLVTVLTPVVTRWSLWSLSLSPQPRKASATCSSATAAAASGLEEWIFSNLHPVPLPKSPCWAPPGLNDWEDDEILASVLAVSQQEYLETMKTSRHRDPAADKS